MDERSKRALRKRRAANGKSVDLPEVESVQLPSDAQGASRREKNRLTFFCRQVITGVFDPDKEMPAGHIAASVLLAVAAKPARLEDMSYFEPAYWLRTHSFVLDGETVTREKGQPVGALGADWREARRQNRSLFYEVGCKWESSPDGWKPGPVRVWFQEKATEDTIIAAELSDLWREEGYEYALKSVDCVASEHTETMDAKSFLNNQIQHSVGVRQTAKTQITDIRFSRLIKVVGEKKKRARRRIHRLTSALRGKTTDLNSTKIDIMFICHAMRKRMVQDNKVNKGVLKAAQMGEWLAHRPTSSGLKPYVGNAWADLPLGSSRLSTEVMDKRMALVPPSGIPTKPDWEKLQAVRQRQRLAFIEKKGDDVPKGQRHEMLADSSPIRGFMDFLDGRGCKPFCDGDNECEAIGPSLTGPDFAVERLDRDAGFLGLHPRVRHAVLMGQSVKELSRRLESTKSKKQSDVAIKRMKDKTQRALKVEELAGQVAELGIHEARKRCVAARVKKTRVKKTMPKESVPNATRAAPQRKLGRKSRESGGMRLQKQRALREDLKALREEMEKQTAMLKESHEAALLEKKVLGEEVEEKKAKAADGGGDCASERQRLKGVAMELSLRCMQLEKYQESLREHQLELEHSTKVGSSSIAKFKRAVASAKAVAATNGKSSVVAAQPAPPLPPPDFAPVVVANELSHTPSTSLAKSEKFAQVDCNADVATEASKSSNEGAQTGLLLSPAKSQQTSAADVDLLPAAPISGLAAPAAIKPDCCNVPLELGQFVQVDGDAAFSLDASIGKKAAIKASALWGKLIELRGDVAVVDVANKGMRQKVASNWLTRIEGAPANPAPWKKNVNWLSSEQRQAIAKLWLPVPVDGARAPSIQTLLSEADVAVGCVEIAWRVLPQRRCVVVPPYLCGLVAHHIKNMDVEWEGSELCGQLEAFAARAEILLMPILVAGHWTLLVVQREGEPAVSAPDPSASCTAEDPSALHGCSKCDNSEKGCSSCSMAAHFQWLARLQHEDRMFNPVEYLAPLPASAWWDIRYYDSLPVASIACSEAAQALLQGLQTVNVHSPMTAAELRTSRENRILQNNGTACGFFVLHFIETEMRRARGEGRWPMTLDVTKRADVLAPVWNKFR